MEIIERLPALEKACLLLCITLVEYFRIMLDLPLTLFRCSTVLVIVLGVVAIHPRQQMKIWQIEAREENMLTSYTNMVGPPRLTYMYQCSAIAYILY